MKWFCQCDKWPFPGIIPEAVAWVNLIRGKNKKAVGDRGTNPSEEFWLPRPFHVQLKPREIYISYWRLLPPWYMEQCFFWESILLIETNVSFCICSPSTSLNLLSGYLVSLVYHVLSEMKIKRIEKHKTWNYFWILI